MSTRRRTELLILAAALAACTPEQSRDAGNVPKQTVDKVGTDLNRNLQQGADRAREAEEKK